MQPIKRGNSLVSDSLKVTYGSRSHDNQLEWQLERTKGQLDIHGCLRSAKVTSPPVLGISIISLPNDLHATYKDLITSSFERTFTMSPNTTILPTNVYYLSRLISQTFLCAKRVTLLRFYLLFLAAFRAWRSSHSSMPIHVHEGSRFHITRKTKTICVRYPILAYLRKLLDAL